MRAIIIGLATVAGITFAVPASAEDVTVRGPGVAVELGGHRDVTVERRAYRDRDDYARGRCRTVVIKHDDGSMKKITKCR